MITLRALALVLALLIPITAAPAASGHAQFFSSQQGAQQHCPTDTVVWVNTGSGVYHFRGQRYYANTKHGAFVCKKEADGYGYRATRNGQ